MFFSRSQAVGSGVSELGAPSLSDETQGAVLVVQKTPWARRLLMQLLIASVLTNVLLAGLLALMVFADRANL